MGLKPRRQGQYHGCAHLVWRKTHAPDSSVLEPLAGLLIQHKHIVGVAQLQVKVDGKTYLCVLVQAAGHGQSFGKSDLDYALTQCDLKGVKYGVAKVITDEFNQNPGEAEVLQGKVEVRTRGRKAAAVTTDDDNGSSKKRAAHSKVDSRTLKRHKKQRSSEDSEADLNATELDAYAKDLRCEPTAAAVVDALLDRIKFLSKVACQPVLTLGNSLGLDLSAHVSAAPLATGALWSMKLTRAQLPCACAGQRGASTARAAGQILCTRGQRRHQFSCRGHTR